MINIKKSIRKPFILVSVELKMSFYVNIVILCVILLDFIVDPISWKTWQRN